MAWYDGATLSQTVYTSLHYHNIARSFLQDNSASYLRVLEAYILAYRKTIDVTYSELATGQVLDGEDCWLDAYGLSTQVDYSISDVLVGLDQCIRDSEHNDSEPRPISRLKSKLGIRRS